MKSRAAQIIVFLTITLAASTTIASQASAGWFVGGSELAAGKTVGLSRTASVDTPFVLRIPEVHFKFECKGSSFLTNKMEIRGENVGGAEDLAFRGCSTLEPATGCELDESNDAEIFTRSLLLSAASTGGADRLTFSPKSGSAFLGIPFNEVNVCAFTGEWVVKGKATFNLPASQTESVLQAMEGLGSVENNSLELEGDPVFIENGKTLLELTSGSKWSFGEPSFAAVASPALLKAKGAKGKVTVENVSGKTAEVKSVSDKANSGSLSEMSFNVGGCKKSYNKGESCGWEVEYTGTGKVIIEFKIEDEHGRVKTVTVSGEP